MSSTGVAPPKSRTLAEVEQRREAVLRSLDALKSRIGMAQLAEDALSLVDPELTLLGKLRSRIEHNKLLTLAVLAGAGWLVAGPRRMAGGKQATHTARTAQAPRTAKEKQDDSGQITREQHDGVHGYGAESYGEKVGKPQESWNGKANEEGSGTFNISGREARRHSAQEQRA
jgi:hypothetical protein